MRNRTKSREYALQMLYQVDIRKATTQQVMVGFWGAHEAETEDIKTFANQLVIGTVEQRDGLDALISSHTDNWDLNRMAVIDRNILRLGTYELLHVQDVPAKVCINEAIELAKRFGDTDSSKFINGILDAIHKKHAKSDANG